MTEQPVETEQQFLGNEPTLSVAGMRDTIESFLGTPPFGELPEVPVQHYSPNAHRLPVDTYQQALARFFEPREAAAKQTDLWLDAEEQATRALAEIQDGNINAGIACLQAALAFAQNYRHSLSEETV